MAVGPDGVAASSELLTVSADTPAPVGIGFDVFCPDCRYCLYSVRSPQCPECGYSLLEMHVEASSLPWLHRDVVGAARAFWVTVFAVVFATRRFCEQFARPMTSSDAEFFRRHCLAYPLAGCVVFYGCALVVVWRFDAASSASDITFLGAGSVPHLLIAFALGMASIWLLARTSCEGARRCIASARTKYRGPVDLESLADYSCAPLALLFPTMAVAGTVLALGPGPLRWWFAAGCILLAGSWCVWLLVVIRLLGRIIPGHRWTVVFITLRLAAVWMLCFAACLLAFPVVVLYTCAAGISIAL